MMLQRDRLRSLGKILGLAGAGMMMTAGVFRQASAALPVMSLATSAIENVPGRFVIYDAFPSAHVLARKLTIWLPPGYEESADQYSVLYMHDGQNLFDASTAMGNQTWGVAEHLAHLLRTDKVRKTIVVGVANTPLRWREYAPAAAINTLSPALRAVASRVQNEGLAEVLADKYLQFLVTELKPYIDKNFRTKVGPPDTFIMGSSMGGLISLYALSSYPEVFGGAGCVSSHWPISTNAAILNPPGDPRATEIAASYYYWLQQHLPNAGKHRVYFDHGTINLDSLYAPLQKRVDDLMQQKGYRQNEDWMTRVFAGADHNEKAWRERLDIPLQFLLKP